MKTKFKLSNRILSLVLALVMVVGLLPMMSLTAQATRTTYIPPFDVTVSVTNNDCGHDCAVSTTKRESYSKNGGIWTYKIGVEWTCGTCTNYNSWSNTSFSDIVVTCNDCEQGTPDTTVTKTVGKVTATFVFNRAATQHAASYIETIPATCTATGEKKVTNCHYCGLTKTLETLPIDPNNHKAASEWSWEDGHHYKVCTNGCGAQLEKAACTYSDATCTTPATCTTCNTAYGTPKSHNLKYAVKAGTTNVCEETCADCDHNATATLAAADKYYRPGVSSAHGTVTYSGNWIGEVDENYTYAVDKVGTATAKVTLIFLSSQPQLPVTLTCNYQVLPLDIANSYAEFYPNVYNGSPLRISVYYSTNGAQIIGTKLTEDDYTLVWDKTDLTQAGDYQVTVTGKGNYTGSFTQKITIAPANLENVSVVNNKAAFDYTGEAQKLDVTASGETVDGSEITFTYRVGETGEYVAEPAVTDGGTHTVYWKASALNHKDVTGSFTVTVNPADGSITIPANQSVTYDGAAVEQSDLTPAITTDGALTVKWYDSEGNEIAAPTDVGTYQIGISAAAGSNYNAVDEVKQTFTITKADPICTAPTAIAGLVYNGREQYLITSAVSMDGTVYYSLDGVTYAESLPKGTNAQEYTVYYKVVGDANHNDMEPKTVTAKIAPWNIETASCKAGVRGEPFTYNGQEHTPVPQIDAWVDDYPVPESPYAPGADVRLTEGTDYTVTYSNNVNAGEAVVTFTGKGNYTGTITRKFTIDPKPITVTIADKTSVYGEAVAELTATDDGIVNNDTNVYSLTTTATSTANAGEYAITGTALDSNYAITFVGGTYTITKAQVNSTGTDMAVDYTAGMEVDLRQMFAVDENAGEVHYWITHLTGEGSFTSEPYLYRIDKAGTFTVKITTKETANYKSGEATAVLTVNPGDPGIGAVTAGVVENTLETSAIVLTRENTDIDGNLTVDAGQTLEVGENTIRYTFTPEDTANYKVVKGEVAVTVVDTIAPVGTVSIDDNKWNDLWNTITFGLFFKETKTVKVAAEDVLSGIAKVEYFDSATALSADAVKAITAWTDMGADYAQDVTAEDAKTFIYYIRITDNAGNVAYISTADATYDLTKPAISGITNGSTYYTTQKVTVTDTNLESVTLNTKTVTGEITLAGNVDKTYTIVATDKAGNETTCTVTMKPIASISTPIDAITESNVNSGNTDAIAEVEAAAAAVDTTNATDTEKAAIKAITDKCDALQEVIADTAAEYERITDAIAAYDPDEVTSADKAELDKLAEDLKALAESGNLTDSEKAALEAPTENLDAMIETVKEVTEESDRIADAVGDYDLETVKSSDKDEIEQLVKDIDALLDTDNLTDEERTALEGEKTKCENLLAKIEGTYALVDKLTEDVGAYDEDTVKSTDKAALEQLVEDIEAVIEGNTNITEEEKAELEALVDTVEDLLAKIEEVAQAPVTEDTEKVEDITSENVTPEDKEDLTNAKADLEDALTENAGNYTEDEKKAIQEEIDRIDDALEAIENVESVEETISELPAIDTVEPDDEDAIKAITDAKAEYDALTDHEKSLVDEDTKKKLDDLCTALVAYDIVKGENGKYTQGGSKGLSFTANGAYSKFSGILVDNKVVDPKHYTAESGSTIVTLKASYLDTLSTGKHTLTVVYTDGETSCEFSIAAKSTTPATGDDSNIMLYGSMFTVSLAAIIVLLLASKKRKQVS